MVLNETCDKREAAVAMRPNQSLQQTFDPVAPLAIAKATPASIAAEHRRYVSPFVQFVPILFVSFSILSGVAGPRDDASSSIRLPSELDVVSIFSAVEAQAQFLGASKVDLIVWHNYPSEVDSVNACAWLISQGRDAFTGIMTVKNQKGRKFSCVLKESKSTVTLEWLSDVKRSLTQMTSDFGGTAKDWSFYFEVTDNVARGSIHNQSSLQTGET